MGHILWGVVVAGLLLGACSPLPREGVREERVLLVKDYRYLPGTPPGDLEVGHALCGTRCNALSADYLNYMEPGGWAMTKVASDREVRIPLGNPFLGGACLCIADEYRVKIDDLNAPPR